MKAKPEAKAGRNESAGTRRSFLLGAGAAGAAGAAVVASKGTALAPARPAEPALDPRGGGGYHVTDHVRQYYRTIL